MNHIWSIWYVIAMVPLQAYLVHLGLGRYHLYRQNNWPNASVELPLNIYLTLYYFTVPLLVIFALTGIFKSGNIAGDNEKLGSQTDRLAKYFKRTRQDYFAESILIENE
uniref:Poly-beta-1,6-N-acetyl-D-glucosamine biosynthesis protein PgaD n=1 Tax=Syphacia muris TaxID=451379 RepID=A0A0N5AF92_9BILA